MALLLNTLGHLFEAVVWIVGVGAAIGLAVGSFVYLVGTAINLVGGN